jgi:hypothetical protein
MKKVKKPTKAQRELAAAEEAMLKRWAAVPKFARTAKPAAVAPLERPQLAREREKRHSLVTPGGTTALKPSPQYTGNKVLGVTVVHKSCLQPVFNVEAAIDAAHMRR